MTTWFVTGASRGMGRELVEQVLARGDTVAATARRPEQLDDLADRHGNRLWRRALDVTDTHAVRGVVTEAFAAHPRIDVVVSNAGYGVFGVAEDLDDGHVETLIATNLTASIQLTRAALPHLRAQGGGLLIQMSSMGGHLTFPGFSLYHATKWGIEGFFDALATEVAPFGIRTILIEPGVVRTGFFDAAPRVPLSAPYVGGPADRPPLTAEEMTDDPVRTVAAIIRAAGACPPPRRLVLGSDAWTLMTAALQQRLDDVAAQRDNAATADFAADSTARATD
ncbi:short-chain dehydrogenase/reductase SDR [Mycolicibacterium canariasense]|uniref:Short-chain dehydrogenase/reductase SDR n=1 Tax=Mycolicibacterium canariasense TaxID=228230 RepID=A0A124E2G0_MYCCR|nr:SDR family oxidoreductase [Mycolicibacterium canariasense]MCV7210060.1 SDR family oxidoreductase [Mycolicibacterium canariasense]ORV04714.1 short-chain dehydrogenase [Mycolicibacterium canariasense]GAS96693.1 short-chain dehydrogenase/reductase SDR [Mycolicibacterium canariasense]